MRLDSAFTARLLGRREETPELPPDLLEGQTILVTGAGGSIGSAVCRALSATNCRTVIALDNHELALLSLQGRYQLELLDLRNDAAVAELLERCKPDVVIHTAAYKHLPLLQKFPFAAFENNTLVTARLTRLSRQLNVPRFLFLSSDKASDPVSILGKSKRLAEMTLFNESQAALRCANVLGSSGSVLRVWSEQLAQGKPLTVARNAERLFISPGEAVSALLTLAHAREMHGLFAPAAASPVLIRDLATRFLCAQNANWPQGTSTLTQAEKESEALCSANESLQRTRSKHLLQIMEQSPAATNSSSIFERIEEACQRRDLPLLLKTVDEALRR